MGLHEVKIKASAQPKKQSCGKTTVQRGEISSSYTFDRWLISRIFKILNSKLNPNAGFKKCAN